jgi:hypothetical protein
MTGRPSDFTQDLADRICSELAEGRSLRSVCKEDWAPETRTIFRWLRLNDEFCRQYARAKEESADSLADEIIEIADDGTNDFVERQTRNGTYVALNPEAAARSRLRVDARKWIASKLKPKKYGEKIEHEHKGEIGHAVSVYIPGNGRDDETADTPAAGAAGEVPLDKR